MATREKTTQIHHLSPDEVDNVTVPMQQNMSLSPDEITEEDAINNVLAELGGSTDAKVNVYKILPGKANSFVGSFTPDTFSQENLQITFGGGDYMVQVRANGRIVTRRNLSIAEARISQPGNFPQTDNTRLIETMNQGFQNMANMFAGALKEIAQALPKPKSTKESLEELALMREIFGSGEKSGGSELQNFLQGIEFSKSIEKDSTEPGTGQLIMEGLKTIAPALGAMAQRQPVPMMAPPVPQANGLAPAPLPNPIEPQAPIESDNEMNIARNIFLNLLVKNAAADHDPFTYANMAVDTLGVEQALEYAQSPDFFKTMCELRPEAQQFPEWFEDFRLEVINICNAEKALTPENENAINAVTSIDGVNDAVPDPKP